MEKNCYDCNDYNYKRKGSQTLPQPPPEHYPHHQVHDSPKSPQSPSIKDDVQLSPCEITYEWLKEGCILSQIFGNQ